MTSNGSAATKYDHSVIVIYIIYSELHNTATIATTTVNNIGLISRPFGRLTTSNTTTQNDRSQNMLDIEAALQTLYEGYIAAGLAYHRMNMAPPSTGSSFTIVSVRSSITINTKLINKK